MKLMNNEEIVEIMIHKVEEIEKEAVKEKYSTENAFKKDTVSKIYKALKEVTENDNKED